MYREEFVQPFSLNSSVFVNSLNSTTMRLLLKLGDDLSSFWTGLEKRFDSFRLVVASKVEADLRTVGFAGNYATKRVSNDLGRIASGIDTISKPLMSLPTTIEQSEEAWSLLQAGANPLIKQPKLIGSFDATSTRQRAKLKKKAPQFEKQPNALAPDALYRSVKTLPSTLKYDYERRVRSRDSEAEAQLSRQLADGSRREDGGRTPRPKELSDGSTVIVAQALFVKEGKEKGGGMVVEEEKKKEREEQKREREREQEQEQQVLRQLVPVDPRRATAIKLLVNLSESSRLDDISKELQWAVGLVREFQRREQKGDAVVELVVIESEKDDDKSTSEAAGRAVRERRAATVLSALNGAVGACARLGKVPARLLRLQRFQEVYASALEAGASGDGDIPFQSNMQAAVEVAAPDTDLIVAGLVVLAEEVAAAVETKPRTWVVPSVERRLLRQKAMFLQSLLELDALSKAILQKSPPAPAPAQPPLSTMINPSAYLDDDDDGDDNKGQVGGVQESPPWPFDSVVEVQQPASPPPPAAAPLLRFELFDDVRGIDLGPRAAALLDSVSASVAGASIDDEGAFVDTTAQAATTDEEKLSKFALTALDILFFLGETAVRAAGPILIDGGALASSRIQQALFPDTGGSDALPGKRGAKELVKVSFKGSDRADGESKVLSTLKRLKGVKRQ